LFGKSFWEKLIDFSLMVAEGVISSADLSLFHYVENAEQAVKIIREEI